ncbi:DISARM system phospholipase D-like protein DrmC [Arthrobacter sp. A2-55]|uniref:DISARM system phospholipase D-like protein DrmC n=1 Tax=Arthrobacter sp. A2-55 TaxID=2897337 RepID=UPI0021CDB509|nr:DISARM system phospholipase D-like protein DrmC [Arthrobacter sp. A2-55]MCU6480474.1 DISARM system phospholipase D-like protein DrmC [Arthrobacter sp. A2-55]
MPSDPFAALGEFLTAAEAEGLAVQLAAGQHITKALGAVSNSRRERAGALLAAAGLGHTDVERSVAVLQAVAGAKAVHRDLTPVWTMPGNEAKNGRLTGEFHRLISSARQSVTCATYNFEKTSQMWAALRESTAHPGVTVTVYVDGDKADSLNIKAQLERATVYRSAILPTGKQVVSHAKFIIIDHEILLLTSANFSFSAENRNIEFGLLVHDSALAKSVESTMTSKHGTLYEQVLD